MSKEVLITGGGGFIGGSLAEKFVYSGEDPVVVSRREGEIGGVIGIERVDSTNSEEVLEVICKYKPKWVYDFAGYSKPSDSKEKPEDARNLMIGSVNNFFDAFNFVRKNLDNTYNPQYILASSVAAFGPGRKDTAGNYEKLNENSGWKPNSEYGKIKASASDLALELGQKHKIHVIVAIQANAGGVSKYLGISQRPGFIVPDNIGKIIKIMRGNSETYNEKGVPVLETGPVEQFLNMTSVDQMVEAYKRLGKTNENGKIIVAAKNSIQVREIINWLLEMSNMEIDHQPSKSEALSQFYDTRKLKQTIGFVPKPISKQDIFQALEQEKKKHGLK